MLRRTCAAALLATDGAHRHAGAWPATRRSILALRPARPGPSDLDTDLVFDDDGDEFEEDFVDIDHKMGYDVGVIFGYDAGIVRAELDLSYKRCVAQRI